MATLRDIRRRISSVRNTQQITNAMKMISAAKLNRAQAAVRAAQPHAARMRRMVTTLAGGLSAEDHPLLEQREGGRSLAVLFTSDRGLCGGFNNNLNRYLHAELMAGERLPEPELIIFGRTGNDFFRRRRVPVRRAVVSVRESERREAIAEVFAEIVERFQSGELGRVYLAFNFFANPIRQVPTLQKLLPVEPPEDGEEAEEGPRDEREVLFEPPRRVILDSLLPRYLESQRLIAHLNTEAGEHGARMVAMEGATKNASEMIARLTLQYNRARQAAITKELIEIVNGAQSL